MWELQIKEVADKVFLFVFDLFFILDDWNNYTEYKKDWHWIKRYKNIEVEASVGENSWSSDKLSEGAKIFFFCSEPCDFFFKK